MRCGESVAPPSQFAGHAPRIARRKLGQRVDWVRELPQMRLFSLEANGCSSGDPARALRNRVQLRLPRGSSLDWIRRKVKQPLLRLARGVRLACWLG